MLVDDQSSLRSSPTSTKEDERSEDSEDDEARSDTSSDGAGRGTKKGEDANVSEDLRPSFLLKEMRDVGRSDTYTTVLELFPEDPFSPSKTTSAVADVEERSTAEVDES